MSASELRIAPCISHPLIIAPCGVDIPYVSHFGSLRWRGQREGTASWLIQREDTKQPASTGRGECVTGPFVGNEGSVQLWFFCPGAGSQ